MSRAVPAPAATLHVHASLGMAMNPLRRAPALAAYCHAIVVVAQRAAAAQALENGYRFASSRISSPIKEHPFGMTEKMKRIRYLPWGLT